MKQNPTRDPLKKYCLFCNRPYENEHGNPAQRTRDHILPRAWGAPKRFTLFRGAVTNWRYMCAECNKTRAMGGHCLAVVVCAKAIIPPKAKHKRKKLFKILHMWAAQANIVAELKQIDSQVSESLN